ncbi:MAG: MATE family efflux transporter [Oceanospirillaceae bacterium]|nr:MATE family efflux transporter [Oceanospirillaceae bacterium]
MSNTEALSSDDAQFEDDRRDKSNHQSHEMLTAPVFGLFLRMAAPIIIGLLVNGLYNFVDAIFIARAVGTHAIGGVTAVFPLHMILISVSGMMAGGMASILSRKLGAGDSELANTIFSSAVFLAFIVGVVFAVLVLIFKTSIFNLLAMPLALQPFADQYITPIALFTAVSFVSGVVSDAFRAEGKSMQMMKMLAIASLLNIFLDWLFLFVFDWGVPGAAWATVISMMVSLIYGAYVLKVSDHLIKFEWSKCRFEPQLHREALSLGVPVFLSYTGYAVMLSAVNFAIVSVATTDAEILISGNGIFNRTFMLIFLPVLGMMIAFQTFAGFNYGAKKYHRVAEVLKVSILTSGIYAILWSVLMILKPQWLFMLFTSDQALISAASEISSIAFIGFFTVGVGMMCPALFQALGYAKPAALLNAFRTYVLLLPMLWLLATQYGVMGIWWTFPVIDLLASIIIGIYTYFFVKKMTAKVAAQ